VELLEKTDGTPMWVFSEWRWIVRIPKKKSRLLNRRLRLPFFFILFSCYYSLNGKFDFPYANSFEIVISKGSHLYPVAVE
jgi:hypothetical protein